MISDMRNYMLITGSVIALFVIIFVCGCYCFRVYLERRYNIHHTIDVRTQSQLNPMNEPTHQLHSIRTS
jgi:hypothetical protein